LAQGQPGVAPDRRNRRRESVIREDREPALREADRHAKPLWRWPPFGDGAALAFALPERPRVVGPRRTDGLVLGRASGFALFDEAAGQPDKIAKGETDLPTTRRNEERADNEERVDLAGRFVCGGESVRPTPDGRIDREAGLPVTNPTCVAFGGGNLNVPFATSVWFGLREGRPRGGAALRKPVRIRTGRSGTLRMPIRWLISLARRIRHDAGAAPLTAKG
jgi:sugar lactone lactonase YvrE